jgi:hypothetical protein
VASAVVVVVVVVVAAAAAAAAVVCTQRFVMDCLWCITMRLMCFPPCFPTRPYPVQEPPPFIDLAKVAVPTPTPAVSVRGSSPASSVGAPSTHPRDSGDGYDADHHSDGNESPRGVLTAARSLAAGAAPTPAGQALRRGTPAGSGASAPAAPKGGGAGSEPVSDNSDDQDAGQVPQPVTTALIVGALGSIPEVRTRMYGAGASPAAAATSAAASPGAGTGSVSPRRRRTRTGFQPTVSVQWWPGLK